MTVYAPTGRKGVRISFGTSPYARHQLMCNLMSTEALAAMTIDTTASKYRRNFQRAGMLRSPRRRAETYQHDPTIKPSDARCAHRLPPAWFGMTRPNTADDAVSTS